MTDSNDYSILEYISHEGAKDRATAESFLLFYADKLADYEREKANAMLPLGTVDENLGGGRSGIISKPTEAIALRSAHYDESHDEYYWLRAVEILQKNLDKRKIIFLKLRREAEKHKHGNVGRPSWVVYTQRRFYEENQSWLGERTIKAWWKQILEYVVEIHLRLKK